MESINRLFRKSIDKIIAMVRITLPRICVCDPVCLEHKLCAPHVYILYSLTINKWLIKYNFQSSYYKNISIVAILSLQNIPMR
jgi:hypothetical protein